MFTNEEILAREVQKRFDTYIRLLLQQVSPLLEQAYTQATNSMDLLQMRNRIVAEMTERATVLAGGVLNDIQYRTLEEATATVDATQQQIAAKAIAIDGGGYKPSGQLPSIRMVRPESTSQLAGLLTPGEPIAEYVNRWPGELKSTIENTLMKTIAAGQHPLTAARLLEKNVGMVKWRAESMARTSLLTAHRMAAQQVFQKNSDVVLRWVWSAAKEKKPCPICWAMHGTKHPVTEVLRSHPSCRCSMIPETPSWEDLGFKGIPDTRVQIKPGEELFANLSEEEQLEALGPARFKLYRDGEYELRDFVGKGYIKGYGEARVLIPVKNLPGRSQDLPMKSPVFQGTEDLEEKLVIAQERFNRGEIGSQRYNRLTKDIKQQIADRKKLDLPNDGSQDFGKKPDPAKSLSLNKSSLTAQNIAGISNDHFQGYLLGEKPAKVKASVYFDKEGNESGRETLEKNIPPGFEGTWKEIEGDTKLFEDESPKDIPLDTRTYSLGGSVDIETLRDKYRSNDIPGRVSAYRLNGNLYLVDGNHDFLAAKLRGDATIPMRIVDVDQEMARRGRSLPKKPTGTDTPSIKSDNQKKLDDLEERFRRGEIKENTYKTQKYKLRKLIAGEGTKPPIINPPPIIDPPPIPVKPPVTGKGTSTTQQKLNDLEERFRRGEIKENTYKTQKYKLRKQLADEGEILPTTRTLPQVPKEKVSPPPEPEQETWQDEINRLQEEIIRDIHNSSTYPINKIKRVGTIIREQADSRLTRSALEVSGDNLISHEELKRLKSEASSLGGEVMFATLPDHVRTEKEKKLYEIKSTISRIESSGVYTTSKGVTFDPKIRSEKVYEVLNEVRPFGDVDITVDSYSSRAGSTMAIRRGSRAFPSEWLVQMDSKAKANGYGGLVVVEEKQRAYFQMRGKTPTIAVTEKQLKGTDGHLGADRTVVHEMGHFVENSVPEVFRAEDAFYKYRTAGESLRPLGPPYDKTEMYRKDKFRHPYQGKEYPHNSYEHLTMHVEALSSDGKLSYSKESIFEDAEMFDYYTGIMVVL